MMTQMMRMMHMLKMILEEEFKDDDNNNIEQIANDLVADFVLLYYEQWYPRIVQNVRILFKITL